MALQCGICFDEGVQDVGDLDCCEHMFCFACISRWLEEESRCPFCKKPVKHLTRKRLLLSEHVVDLASDSSPVRPTKKMKWTVLEKLDVPERWQVVENDLVDLETLQFQQHLETMVCEMCHTAEDEDLILLCDGCDNGFHTYCLGLSGVPDGEFYCLACCDRTGASESSDVSASIRTDTMESPDEESDGVEFVATALCPRRRRSPRQRSQQTQRTVTRTERIRTYHGRPERTTTTGRRLARLPAVDMPGWRSRRPLGRVAQHRVEVNALRTEWEHIRRRGFAVHRNNGATTENGNRRLPSGETSQTVERGAAWLENLRRRSLTSLRRREETHAAVIGRSWTDFDCLRGQSGAPSDSSATTAPISGPLGLQRADNPAAGQTRVTSVSPTALTRSSGSAVRSSSTQQPSIVSPRHRRKRSRSDFETEPPGAAVETEGQQDNQTGVQPKSPQATVGNAASGSTSERPSSRSAELYAWRRDLKRDACAIAKDILRAMLHQGKINRAQFKEAAQCATRRVYEKNKYQKVSLTTAMVQAEIDTFLKR